MTPAVSRRAFLRAGAAALAGGAGLVGYTLGVEPEWERVVFRDLPVATLPPSLAGARLVQISDLHSGPRVRAEYLLRCFDRVRALAPAIVAITGDFVSADRDGPDLGHLREILPHLPHGARATLGILGNHDYGRGWSDYATADRVASMAEAAGVRMLRNETHAVDGLDVVGVDDLWAQRARPERALAARASDAALALCHNPDAMDVADWRGYAGWVLAGHTHGGQCKAPFLPAPVVPVKNHRYVAGAVDAGGGRTLYINRGLGYILRARFNVRPEITCFTLRPATAHDDVRAG